MAVASVAQEMRDRLSAIRHPETGEFATVVAEGDALGDMRFRIEGSAALLEIVKARLLPEELEGMTFAAIDAESVPRAFLSYGWEDRELARKIAEGLQVNGIETWWAEWEIRAGDSIRRKIDAGLGECTHFIVLLTPTSITRPWVNEEIDAGFMRKVSAKSRFIPLRHGLPVEALPPLMSCMLSPAIEPSASCLQQLVNDIHGVNRKPNLGEAPLAAVAPMTGYSPAASAVAGVFVGSSRHGVFADPQLTVDVIAQRTSLTEDDVEDALHELRHFLNVSLGRVLPKESLYSEFDRHWKPWDPAADALKLAADLVNDPEFPSAPPAIADRYGWPARRLNPAMAYLQERNAARLLDVIGSGPFITARITRSDATRRFVRSRS